MCFGKTCDHLPLYFISVKVTTCLAKTCRRSLCMEINFDLLFLFAFHSYYYYT